MLLLCSFIPLIQIYMLNKYVGNILTCIQILINIAVFVGGAMAFASLYDMCENKLITNEVVCEATGYLISFEKSIGIQKSLLAYANLAKGMFINGIKACQTYQSVGPHCTLFMKIVMVLWENTFKYIK